MVDYVTVMAGGGGTRLWPVSTAKKPKQFMNINDGMSLFIRTLKRALSLAPRKGVLVVTHKDHVEAALAECSELTAEERRQITILPEPIARNTAPALTFAAQWIKTFGSEDDVQLVLAADHIIKPFDSFAEAIGNAAQVAASGNIVVFGITPLRPDTGYGYIETTEEAVGKGVKVRAFTEKPNTREAERMISAGNYYWNSGMFLYQTSNFLKELESHSPDVASPFAEVGLQQESVLVHNEIKVASVTPNLKSVYEKTPAISVDYAVMEHASKMAMITGDFTWNDVGSWDVIADLEEDSAPVTISVESTGNYIRSDIPVALCGVSDLIVVINNGVAMVCRKGDSQLVKEAKEKMEKKNQELRKTTPDLH